MGWSRGSEVMEAVIEGLQEAGVSTEQRRDVYVRVARTLFDLDWDTVDEVKGKDKVFDKMLREEFPDEADEEEEDERDEALTESEE